MIGQAGLKQQGYNCYTSEELKSISNGLRFTPLVCMFLAIYGLYIQSPFLHFGIAALGIIPFWFPNHHPFDIFYNRVFRHMVGGKQLPSNPLPRRIACLMGGLMNIGIGLSFYYGNINLAYVFGATLVLLQLIVITTHFCLASWFYEMGMKLIGKWDEFIPLDQAKNLISEGAILVDVRSPAEYAASHIEKAINIPLENIQNDDRLKGKTTVLYCRTGMRSGSAKKQLEQLGNKEVYNLGGMKRWI